MENEQKIMDKLASMSAPFLASGDKDGFRKYFQENAGGYIKTFIEEECWCDKVLPLKPVTADHPMLHISEKSDTFYWQEEIQGKGATAMQASYRSGDKPTFIDGKRYRFDISEIRMKPVKKPQLELLAAKNLIRFIKEDGADKIRRQKDSKFKALLDAAVARTGNRVIATGDIIERDHFTALFSLILRYPLKVTKILMSTQAWNSLLKWGTEYWDNKISEVTEKGIVIKNLFSKEVIVTINGNDESLRDNGSWDPSNYGCPFDNYDSDNTLTGTSIYAFTEPDYLGRNIQLGDINIDSKWDGPIFQYQS